jgi:hypothetical protein
VRPLGRPVPSFQDVRSEHAATLSIDTAIGQRTPGPQGFTPLPKRWAAERTYGWLMFHRRLAARLRGPAPRSEAVIQLAVTGLMARRLTGEATVSSRDPTSRDQTLIPG